MKCCVVVTLDNHNCGVTRPSSDGDGKGVEVGFASTHFWSTHSFSAINERQRAILEELAKEEINEGNRSSFEGNWWQQILEHTTAPKFMLELSLWVEWTKLQLTSEELRTTEINAIAD
ncbi:hypothetical protein V8G54_035205 [Vigna mungo]|uniref:Uncharacterized protein n=1 Tax=Vigna mungo TaxID=3915 RepID=A0AAQ3MEM5_VIGMU